VWPFGKRKNPFAEVSSQIEETSKAFAELEAKALTMNDELIKETKRLTRLAHEKFRGSGGDWCDQCNLNERDLRDTLNVHRAQVLTYTPDAVLCRACLPVEPPTQDEIAEAINSIVGPPTSASQHDPSEEDGDTP
jgi:hypothetical protein